MLEVNTGRGFLLPANPYTHRMAHSFPIARRLLAFAGRARRNWLDRHRHPFNYAIHLVGIPLAVAGVVLLFLTDWYWGATAFVLGYLLQWVGHRVEGNDVGELIPVKKMLGLPYVAVVGGADQGLTPLVRVTVPARSGLDPVWPSPPDSVPAARADRYRRQSRLIPPVGGSIAAVRCPAVASGRGRVGDRAGRSRGRPGDAAAGVTTAGRGAL